MVVPILTLYELKNRYKESFLHINQIKIKEIGSSKDYMELDVCCICNGKIIIGECKKPNKVHMGQIRKYAELCEKLGAEKVIFSTINNEGFSKDVEDNIKKVMK